MINTDFHPDGIYRKVLTYLLEDGTPVKTRNAEVLRECGVQVTFGSTPLICARRTAWKNALREMEWFLSGSNNINDLHPAVRPWWEPWADSQGVVRHNYASQLRTFHGVKGAIDQIEYLLEGVRDHPFSRRNVVTTWNTADMISPDCPITNCWGTVIQVFGKPDDTIDLITYQRSADFICGVPHNWIQIWAFLLWVASRTGKKPGRLAWIGGDVHLYTVHRPIAQRILESAYCGETPQLVYTPTSDKFLADDFSLDREYRPIFSERAEMVI